jgi:hypothetical protein
MKQMLRLIQAVELLALRATRRLASLMAGEHR